MQGDLTDITLVLDRSGSMDSIRDDVIGGVNAFLDEQRKAPGRANLTLVQFDNLYETVHAGVPIGQVPPLTAATFVPRGGTALLDAMGRTIVEAGARLSALPEADRPGKVVVVIFTDGEENQSTEYTADRIKAMTTHQAEVYAWQFVYLGANQDAIAVAGRMGVPAANAVTYRGQNFAAVTARTSARLRSFRGGEAPAMGFTDEERAEAMEP